ncbi:MAG: DNA ligase D [Candidatus Rokubacteria bacterium]|nr:DNA ligase D [Candidatus Rokubacteria bacterium]
MSRVPSSSLEVYRRKRDPERTPEPFGGRPGDRGSLFVVQKHAARRLHYDLRLEMDGTLKSWAVPKGPSIHPGEKRLAVHVEDHPVEYADFEGVIPKGNYGAGPVIVWDRGWYRPVKAGEPLAQLERGKLEVELHGVKLRGGWTLARMSGKVREWLLLKKADAWAGGEEPTERFPQSVLSGLTVEELRETPARLAALRGHLEALGVPRGGVSPRNQPLMLATPAERPPEGEEWLFEIKYDGVRVLAGRSGDAVELLGRSGQVVTERYPEIAAALRTLPLDRFVLDGEIVALDETGRPSFQRLQERMHLARPLDVERARGTVPVTAIFFDCLALDGRDLRRLPLHERKHCLSLLLPARGVISYGDHVVGHGSSFFATASEQRLEGILAKRIESRYAGGRTRDWLKIKCERRQEFVIGGYTDPQGSRGHFGALHLGLYEDGRLRYVSKVGTGFDAKTLRLVWDKLQPLARPTSPFDVGSPAGPGHHWAEPRLVCDVRFTEWTRDGGIRHPAFLGLRDDKKPQDCRRESAARQGQDPNESEGPVGGGQVPSEWGSRAEGPAPLPPGARPARSDPPGFPSPAPARVRVTNPDKVFWPDEGYTKGDLIAYYDSVAPLLLPYLRDRPLVLTRYPDGIGGKSFFQKDAPDFVPAWVRTERVYGKDAEREIDYFVVNDAETLRYVVNLGTIPLHLWGSRVGSLERPDWLVLDLDPKGAPFTDVVKVARALHRILERLEMPSHVKTSGATGLHILIPLGARYTYEQTRTFARLLALLGVEAEPGISTVVRPVRARRGRVYIDFLQNAHGQTIVAPFSVRPLPGAPVSCPLRWAEVTARLDPARFTLRTAPARFARLGDPMAPVLSGAIDMATVLGRMERLFGAGRAKATKRRP